MQDKQSWILKSHLFEASILDKSEYWPNYVELVAVILKRNVLYYFIYNIKSLDSTEFLFLNKS